MQGALSITFWAVALESTSTLCHRDMALEGGVPVAVFGPFTSSWPPPSRLCSSASLKSTAPPLTVSWVSTPPTRIQTSYLVPIPRRLEVGHLGAVGQVRLPVEDGELILQAMAGLGIAGGVDWPAPP